MDQTIIAAPIAMPNILTNIEELTITNFVKFLLERNVLNIAIGLILTLQITAIVNSFVNNILSPILNKLLTKNKVSRLSEYTIALGKEKDVQIEVGMAIMVLLRSTLIIYGGYLIFVLIRKNFIEKK
jgi:large-conductance mechanosensitive channel